MQNDNAMVQICQNYVTARSNIRKYLNTSIATHCIRTAYPAMLYQQFFDQVDSRFPLDMDAAVNYLQNVTVSDTLDMYKVGNAMILLTTHSVYYFTQAVVYQPKIPARLVRGFRSYLKQHVNSCITNYTEHEHNRLKALLIHITC